VITDLNLPDSKGLDTLEAIVAASPSSAIIVQSIRDSDLALKAVKLGAQDYLYKGLGDEQTFKRIIEFSLERKSFVTQVEKVIDERNHELLKRTHELEKAKTIAEEAGQAKSRFFASITHELRTPLHAVINFSEFGLKKVNDAPREKLKSYYENTHTSAQRLLRMVNALLDLSRIQSGQTQLHVEEHDMIELINSTLIEFSGLLEDRGLEVIIDKQASQTTLFMDEDMVTRVLINLISNAIKFSPLAQGAALTIALEDTILDGEVPALSIRVSDQGEGIPEDELELIFDEFMQSSKKIQTGSFGKGTGLGLAISRDIVARHHGTITAANNSDRGASFTFTLPLKPVIDDAEEQL
jgi:signal transduction histidine kinase